MEDGSVSTRPSDFQDGGSLGALFTIAAFQVEKIQLGTLNSVTAFYEGIILLHVNAAPLILTLIGTPTANAGALLAIGCSLREGLRADGVDTRKAALS